MIKLIVHRTLPLLALLFAGCIPEEEAIAPYDRGEAQQATIEMQSDYRYQLYIDIETGSIVSSNLITDWDVGFRCDPEGHHVILNSARISAVADMGPIAFESPVSTTGLDWQYDVPSGEWDSTAIGQWWTGNGTTVQSKNHLYIVDRGYTPAGKAVGYAKLMILSASPTEYVVQIAELDNSNQRVISVPRDTTRNFAALSFQKGNEHVQIEPPKDSWDILFTRYTHIFYAPDFTPYSVTGILLNRHYTEVAVDSSRAFAEVSLENIDDYQFTTKLDIIGYDWKTFDLDKGVFTIHSPVYLLRDSKGFYYKLHLLDFYNGSGEKGFPTIEWQKL